MRSPAIGILVLAIVSSVPAFPQTSKAASKSDQDAIVITFKDGHQQTYSLSEVSKIEFKTPATPTATRMERATLAGKWKVGTGGGMGGTFYITLATDGTASRSMGSERGTWEMVGSEARISWDDGWHDVIRKTGNRYEKAAYAPGRSLNESPSNVASAVRTETM